ncbi:hypothetical protein HDE_12243 [Halotydeus destructor]|nr:hypothetical protein HDE_12243 [Halotydeus destructor]
MAKTKKFSVDTDLAVQVDKLSKELEESKAREEQLSKLADDMIQVISNYQLEVSKKDAEIEELRKKLHEPEHDVQISKSNEVTSSAISASLSRHETDNDEETIASTQDSKLQICLKRIRSSARRNETIVSLLDSRNLPAELRCYLGWFLRPTTRNIPSNYSRIISRLKNNLKPVKKWLKNDVQIVKQLNLFEKDVFDIMASVFGKDPTVPEVDSVVQPPSKKVKMEAPAVFEKFVSDSLLEEASSIVEQDETFKTLLERGTDLPKKVLQAIDWLQNPNRYKPNGCFLPENITGAVCKKFFILKTCVSEEDKRKLSACFNRVNSCLRKGFRLELEAAMTASETNVKTTE